MSLKQRLQAAIVQPVLHPCPRCRTDEARLTSCQGGYKVGCVCGCATTAHPQPERAAADWNTKVVAGPVRLGKLSHA